MTHEDAPSPRRLPGRMVAVGLAGVLLGVGGTAAVVAASDRHPPPSAEGEAAGSAEGASPSTEVGATDAVETEAVEVDHDGSQMRPDYAPTLDDREVWPLPQRSTFSSSFDAQPGVAELYALDAVTSSTSERVTELATALGMVGTPELVDGTWRLTDGTKELTVGGPDDGSLGYSFTNGQAQQPCDGCATPGGTAEAAEAALRELLAGIGLPSEDFEYEVGTVSEGAPAIVSAMRVLDGRLVELAHALHSGPSGTTTASGSLADLVPLREVQTVSEGEAVQRLNDPRFGAARTGWPGGEDPWPVLEPGQAVPQPRTPTSDEPVRWPVDEVEIISARPTLVARPQPDFTVIMLPSFTFTDADGGTWTVPTSVADAEIDFRFD
ncbi:hypothetical protein [Litorihabitans aurantiacus]|uniref:Uncharacterized protein n=1 Tax=Litorihabitans aurantiacus TaxID=1930061 RepID=A0AA37XG51_9MICO|nr:hypothetical protein [Litorihabitans aurantiacus]GMA32509.1 hypothetical protein GCM10025875_25010 [Litorihabitans aurantiacus]